MEQKLVFGKMMDVNLRVVQIFREIKQFVKLYRIIIVQMLLELLLQMLVRIKVVQIQILLLILKIQIVKVICQLV